MGSTCREKIWLQFYSDRQHCRSVSKGTLCKAQTAVGTIQTLSLSARWERKGNVVRIPLGESSKKPEHVTVRLTVSADLPPPPYSQFFCDFFVYFWPYIEIICVLKRILHNKKSFFMQLLESPIPSLTAAALRMIICKRPAPHFDNQEKSVKNAFLRLLTMR